MSDTRRNQLPEAEAEPKRHSLLVDLFVRLLKEKPLGTVGLVIVLILFFTGIFADLLVPYGMNESHLADRLEAPSAQYILGTDNLGRDLLTRIIYGARISMIVGLVGASINVFVATTIGVLSGFLGGKFDLVVQRFVDAWLCFPWLFLVLAVMSILGPGLMQVVIVLGTIWGVYYSRIIRSAVIGIKENLYVEAAVAIGATRTQILIRHILPNVMAPIIIIFSISVGAIVLGEATISFLGFGIPPPQPSWGGMISGEGRRFMLLAPHLAIWPGLALGLVVYGMNMLGDAVRDLLDPRLRGGLGRYGRVKRRREQT